MQITYELTQKDFYEALVASRNRRPRAKWILRASVLVGFLLSGVVLFVWFAADPEMRERTSLLPLFILDAFLVYIMWGGLWWAAHALYSKRPSVRGPQTIHLDHGGIRVTGNGATSEVEWGSLILWSEGKNHFLYYYSPAIFDLVPKRAMTPDQVNEFRALLSENIKA